MATTALLLPVGLTVVSQLLIWAIPGCDPNPYATEGCVVGGREIGARLVQGVLGGLFLTVISTLFVTLPLFAAAAVWSMIRRRAGGKLA